MKSWEQRSAARDTLSRETGFVRKPHANRLRVALAFPNTYYVGMSNLGFQWVYRLFNDLDAVVCERVFLPPKQQLAAMESSRSPLVTLESQTAVNEFDVLAFSISFEWDYTNVLAMLRLAGLPIHAAERDHRHPLVVAGGAITFLNPEPLAPFVDLFAIGDGEELVPVLATEIAAAGDRRDAARSSRSRARLLRAGAGGRLPRRPRVRGRLRTTRRRVRGPARAPGAAS